MRFNTLILDSFKSLQFYFPLFLYFTLNLYSINYQTDFLKIKWMKKLISNLNRKTTN